MRRDQVARRSKEERPVRLASQAKVFCDLSPFDFPGEEGRIRTRYSSPNVFNFRNNVLSGMRRSFAAACRLPPVRRRAVEMTRAS